MPTPAFGPADILLPAQGTDLAKWAVLACDQHTSDPDYWRKAAEIVAGAPSTLDIILPEVYLELPGVEGRIEAIHAAMARYARQVLTRRVQGLIYVERTTPAGTRRGLVGAVDLEAYDYKPGTAPAVRPSEGTVEARIPPRLAVRRGAALESPHILLLMDDEADTALGAVAAAKPGLPPLYDVELMLGGGRLRGWAVEDAALISRVEDALAGLADPGRFCARYGAPAGAAPFALAVGDGNHSLATAKAAWEELKPTLPAAQRETHPARRCLVELENIQSPAIGIEPIHRVAFGPSGEEVLRALGDYARLNGARLLEGERVPGAGMHIAGEAGPGEGQTPRGGAQHFTLLYQGRRVPLALENAPLPLAVGTADAALALLAEEHPGLRVDYIHGEGALQALVDEQGAVGLLMPPFEKQDLFRGVALGGVLPKKTFSMGHAEEKRYYMECRAITTD